MMPPQPVVVNSTLSVKLLIGALFVLGVACGIVSVSYSKWYTIEQPAVLLRDYGVFWQCQRIGLASSTTCIRLSFSDITSGCSRRGDDMLKRTRGLAGTSTAAPVVFGVALAFFLLTGRWQVIGRWVSCLLTTIAVALNGFSLAWSAHLYNDWYFCGVSYCDFMRTLGSTGSCSSGAGASWYFVVAGLILSVVALGAQAVLLVRQLQLQAASRQLTSSEEPTSSAATVKVSDSAAVGAPVVHSPLPSTPPPPASITPARNEPTTPAAPVVSSPPQEVSDRPPAPQRWPDFTRRILSSSNVLPDGEWIYDASCSLYWSNAEQLYVHLESGLFYDPHSCMWFDSETNEWFEA